MKLTTLRAVAATLLLPLLLSWCPPAAARVVILPSGRLALIAGGKVALRGVNPDWVPAPTTGWINATMTSNSAPSPNSVTSDYTLTDAWKAFDHDLGTNCEQNDSNPFGNIYFDFGTGNSATVNQIKISNVASYGVSTWDLYGMDEYSVSHLITSGTASDTTSVQSWSFSNTTAYQGYALSYSMIDTGTSICRVNEIQLWGAIP